MPKPGAVEGEATRVQGQFIRDVIKLNPTNFRVFSPDETVSNRWGAVFEVTDRCSTAEITAIDDHVAPNGRVMEMLSEHQCEGWLEGYLLTGRHGFFSCYEAFIHIVDSMFNQHAKWLNPDECAWHRGIGDLSADGPARGQVHAGEEPPPQRDAGARRRATRPSRPAACSVTDLSILISAALSPS